MIRLESIEVRGQCEKGPFSGALELSSGLQVISARNGYGKSLAVKAVPWCLGIEPIFGSLDNDPSFFSQAVREELELPDGSSSPVLSSECSITIVHDDGRRLKLTRPVKGERTAVWVEEIAPSGEVRNSKLVARRGTMQDEHGGLQHFLFEWLKWPRVEVSTFKGSSSEIYLENLAPLFYIDQSEGWTDVQAQQIGRYGQQQISEIAFEYLLGAIGAIRTRVARQRDVQRNAVLRETARGLADRITSALLRRGWSITFSGHGTVSDTLSRWSARTITQLLAAEANVDLAEKRLQLNARAEKLRKTLTSDPIDTANGSAPAAVSQRLIDLKQNRHALNVEINSLRIQYEQADELVGSLERRIQAATDLLRLKKSGVGRLEHVECPTCHRDLDPATFALTDQSTESVSAHIEALKRDRALIETNRESLRNALTITRNTIGSIDSDIREAERALQTVTSAVGTVREQVAHAAAQLTTTERELDRIAEAAEEIEELQVAVKQWVQDARAGDSATVTTDDLHDRRSAFLSALRSYLTGLGHNAINEARRSFWKDTKGIFRRTPTPSTMHFSSPNAG